MLSAMKQRAANTAEPISHIVDTCYAQVEVGWAHLLPTLDARHQEDTSTGATASRCAGTDALQKDNFWRAVSSVRRGWNGDLCLTH